MLMKISLMVVLNPKKELIRDSIVKAFKFTFTVIFSLNRFSSSLDLDLKDKTQCPAVLWECIGMNMGRTECASTLKLPIVFMTPLTSSRI